MKPRLIKGRDGVFEVKLDDELVYSKRATGRFPDAGEVESSSSARRGGQVMALDVNKSVTRGLLGSSTRIQTRTPVAKDQATRYFVDR